MNEQYKLWLDNVKELDKEILKEYTSSQIEECFSTSLKFGTGGVREELCLGSSKLNVYTVDKILNGIVKYINVNKLTKTVVIAYDSRYMSKEFSYQAYELLTKNGIKCELFDDVQPTPVLSYSVRELGAGIGIMVTASHNPSNYNGIKVYNQLGCQLNITQARELIEYVGEVEIDFNLNLEFNPSFTSNDIVSSYKKSLSAYVYNQEMDNIKILFSAVNGCSYEIIPELFKEYGIKTNLVNAQCIPDSDFMFADSINPEDEACFNIAMNYVSGQDLILITDPDADRVGVKVLHDGKYIRVSGNQMGALLIDYIISKKDISAMKNPTVYNTIVTGELGAKVAKSNNVNVKSTLTGFKYIGEQISINKEDDFLFGYEESYGYLLNDEVRDKDAISASLMIVQMVSDHKKNGNTLIDRYNEIEQEFGYHIEETISLNIKSNQIQLLVEEFKKIKEISEYKVTKIIDYNVDSTGLPKENVIKIFIENYGFIVIRPSGTEPKIKYYIAINNRDKVLLDKIYYSIKDKLGLN